MSTTLTTAPEHSSHIDAILEKYLGLLDTYTTLRAELSNAVSSIHHSLARANFSSPNPRGLRWGEEAVYAASGNREMRAERRVTVCEDGERIRVVRNEDGDEEEDEKQDERKEKSESSENKENDDEEDENDEDEPEGEEEERKKGDKLPNLFGILLPPALRAARVESIKMVEEIVPRLAKVEGEMRAVEIEVRRARKRMAKVGAAGEKGTGKK